MPVTNNIITRMLPQRTCDHWRDRPVISAFRSSKPEVANGASAHDSLSPGCQPAWRDPPISSDDRAAHVQQGAGEIQLLQQARDGVVERDGGDEALARNNPMAPAAPITVGPTDPAGPGRSTSS